MDQWLLCAPYFLLFGQESLWKLSYAYPILVFWVCRWCMWVEGAKELVSSVHRSSDSEEQYLRYLSNYTQGGSSTSGSDFDVEIVDSEEICNGMRFWEPWKEGSAFCTWEGPKSLAGVAENRLAIQNLIGYLGRCTYEKLKIRIY